MSAGKIANGLAFAMAVVALWAVAMRPSWAQTYLTQATEYIRTGEYEKAIKALKDNRADERRGKISVPTVDNLIGWSYFSLGKLTDSEVYLKQAMAGAERSGNVEVQRLAANNLGVLYFVQGDLDQSLAFFNRPETRDSEIAQQYRNLIAKRRVAVEAEKNAQQGIAYRSELNFEQAVQAYDKALALQPSDPRLLEFKAYSLYRMQRYDEALNVARAALQADGARSREQLPLNVIKIYCATGQDGQIAPLIQSTKVAPATLHAWWDKDRELRSVCAKSIAMHTALTQ